MPFSFDARTHSYTVNGVLVPSCTRTLDMSGLVSYEMVKREILERKSDLGTKVHEATQFYDEDDLDWNSLHDLIKPRVDAWALFRSDTGFVPRRIEKSYCATVNGMTFGLKVDREGIFKRTEAIVDLKTSENIEPWVAIQTAGYALGVPDYEGQVIAPLSLFHRRRRLAVQLKANGKYKKYEFEDPRDASIYLSALHITYWKIDHGAKISKIEDV